jgi:hypothetical protein
VDGSAGVCACRVAGPGGSAGADHGHRTRPERYRGPGAAGQLPVLRRLLPGLSERGLRDGRLEVCVFPRINGSRCSGAGPSCWQRAPSGSVETPFSTESLAIVEPAPAPSWRTATSGQLPPRCGFEPCPCRWWSLDRHFEFYNRVRLVYNNAAEMKRNNHSTGAS